MPRITGAGVSERANLTVAPSTTTIYGPLGSIAKAAFVERKPQGPAA